MSKKSIEELIFSSEPPQKKALRNITNKDISAGIKKLKAEKEKLNNAADKQQNKKPALKKTAELREPPTDEQDLNNEEDENSSVDEEDAELSDGSITEVESEEESNIDDPKRKLLSKTCAPKMKPTPKPKPKQSFSVDQQNLLSTIIDKRQKAKRKPKTAIQRLSARAKEEELLQKKEADFTAKLQALEEKYNAELKAKEEKLAEQHAQELKANQEKLKADYSNTIRMIQNKVRMR